MNEFTQIEPLSITLTKILEFVSPKTGPPGLVDTITGFSMTTISLVTFQNAP